MSGILDGDLRERARCPLRASSRHRTFRLKRNRPLTLVAYRFVIGPIPDPLGVSVGEYLDKGVTRIAPTPTLPLPSS